MLFVAVFHKIIAIFLVLWRSAWCRIWPLTVWSAKAVILLSLSKSCPAISTKLPVMFVAFACCQDGLLDIFFLFDGSINTIQFPPSSDHNAGTSVDVNWSCQPTRNYWRSVNAKQVFPSSLYINTSGKPSMRVSKLLSHIWNKGVPISTF